MGSIHQLPEEKEPTTTLILSDLHGGRFTDHKALALALNLFKLTPISQRRVVLLGDILDCHRFYSDEAYKFNLKNAAWDSYFIPAVEEDSLWFSQLYDLLRQMVLDPENIKMVEGNHEERLRRPKFIDRVPVDLKHHFNLRHILKADERKLQVIDYNDCYHLPVGEGLRFAHGAYCGMNVLKKHFMVNPVPMVIGHTHEQGMFAAKTDGEDASRVYYNIGCMCVKAAGDYMRKRPDNWCTGFGVVNVDTETWDLSIMRIKDNKLFLPTGEVFKV